MKSDKAGAASLDAGATLEKMAKSDWRPKHQVNVLSSRETRRYESEDQHRSRHSQESAFSCEQTDQ